jgi:Transmembrane amino acid transporter protein
MGIVAHSAPNYAAAAGTSLAGVSATPAPVITKVIITGGGGNFENQLNAVMNIVYAYGGAMVFVEFMSEMKRPMDFIKGMAMAQTIIFTCYLLYGLFVYAYQGQYVVNPANQGVSTYGWQTALNIISLLSALIAAGMYGNVGIKVVYNTLIKKVLRGPDINSRDTKSLNFFGARYDMPVVMIWWIPMVVIYWSVAYVVASSIPNFSALTGLVGAICILQFTYTFPPMMKFGLDFQMSAMKADGPFDPETKRTNRIDTWKDWSRWSRAYGDRWILNTFHILLFLASAATAALGIYSNVKLLIGAFAASTVTSFTCVSPVA